MIAFLIAILPFAIGITTLVAKGIISVQAGGLALLVCVFIAEFRVGHPGALVLLGACVTLYVFETREGAAAIGSLIALLIALYGLYLMMRGPFLGRRGRSHR